MSWRRSEGSRTSIEMTPSSPASFAAMAASSAAPASWLRSAEFERVCSATRMRPSGRTIAGWPSGRRVTKSNSTEPWSASVRAVIVAAGMSSRMATSSISFGRPS